uniref:Uncharacterized protein n=1 Tax=Glossina brevipalpis TaxID=37001 RepID=A0A1A9VZG9_9MUSC
MSNINNQLFANAFKKYNKAWIGKEIEAVPPQQLKDWESIAEMLTKKTGLIGDANRSKTRFYTVPQW